MNNQSLVIEKENENAKRITRMAVTDVEEVKCDNGEADSRMFIHAHYAAENENVGRVIITSPDTDVVVLCLFHYSMLNINKLWFHTGTVKKRRFIPMHIIAEKLSEEIIRVLLAFHTLTGCDSTSAPFGCGKKVAYCTLKGNIERFKELSNLRARAESSNISEEFMDTAIEFIYSLYDQKNRASDINSLRYKLSVKKGLESSKLLPTKDSAILHVYSTNYAQCPFLSLPSPVENGWIKPDGEKLQPALMTNLPEPENLIELTFCQCRKKCINNTCHCRKANLSCIESCSCGEFCVTSILMSLTNKTYSFPDSFQR